MQHQAGDKSHEAWQRRPPGAWNLSHDLGRRRERSPGRLWPGWKHLYPQSVAGNLPNHLVDPERYLATYYRKYCKNSKSKDWRDWPYFCNDGAMQAADGYYRILGRVDDVINVAGHRLGTKELENACLTVEEVAEAAVVPVVDEVRGRVPEIYVTLN